MVSPLTLVRWHCRCGVSRGFKKRKIPQPNPAYPINIGVNNTDLIVYTIILILETVMAICQKDVKE